MVSAFPTRLFCVADEHFTLEDYAGGVPRWCAGCGDNAVMTAVQRVCRDEQLAPERTVFVSGIGCSSRFPHYMNAYGFHGIHGRALPVAEGIKMARPDLDIFVITGDGDCCSIGAAHWLHALRYNMDLTVLLLDNQVYALTKKQASPTTPHGVKTNTTPVGAWLEPLNPMLVSLGVTNVSFVAQIVDWIPEVMHQVISLAYHHKGLSFVRVLQRCPEFMPDAFEPWIRDPGRIRLLVHEDGLHPGPTVTAVYRNQERHDPGDLGRAREIAAVVDPIAVGILYRNESVPRYEAARGPQPAHAARRIREIVERELDKYTVAAADS